MSDRTYTVYKHTSPSGKVYIGITKTKPEKRWKNGNGYMHNSYFWRAIQKYGWDNIKHEILFTNLTKEEAEQTEIDLIAEYKSNKHDFGYNIESGGNGIGKHSEESKKKISEANKGNLVGEKNPMYGKKGILHHMYGKHLSEEHKEKLRKAHKGKILSKEHKIEISKSNKGKVFSDEHKQKISEAHSGENNYWYGKTFSDEHKQKMSEAHSGGKNHHAKKVFCNGLIFSCGKECAEYYNKNYGTFRAYLNGRRKMPKEWQDLGLRYATEEDISKYPTYKKY